LKVLILVVVAGFILTTFSAFATITAHQTDIGTETVAVLSVLLYFIIGYVAIVLIALIETVITWLLTL
jgi:hypothetical protein